MNFFRFIKEFFDKYSPAFKELHSKRNWFVSGRQLSSCLEKHNFPYFGYTFDPIIIEVEISKNSSFRFSIKEDFLEISFRKITNNQSTIRLIGCTGFLYYPELDMIVIKKETRFRDRTPELFQLYSDTEIDLSSLDEEKIMELSLQCPISPRNDYLDFSI